MAPEAAMPRPVLSTSNLQVYYGKVHAVQGVSIEIRAGEVVALLGANGAGKSSIIRALVGLTPASGGGIWLRDQRIDALPSDARGQRMHASLNAIGAGLPLGFGNPAQSGQALAGVGQFAAALVPSLLEVVKLVIHLAIAWDRRIVRPVGAQAARGAVDPGLQPGDVVEIDNDQVGRHGFACGVSSVRGMFNTVG